jgi:hypothetical protein
VLPLGYKSEWGFFKRGKVLNLGMLDPGRKDAIVAAQKEASLEGNATSTRIFLVLADQFLDVLQSVYGLSADDLAARSPDQLDPTLGLFLGERM